MDTLEPRREAVAAKLGNFVIGSDQPIRVQSRTTTDAPALNTRGLSIRIPLRTNHDH